MERSYEHVVVVGASAGGVSALLRLSEGLPPLFAAPVCIVQHIGSNRSLLAELLQHRGANPAVHARDGERLAPGTLYVAPPDRHVLVDGDRLRLTHGPKENHARPAIDPLFRSAAASFGARVIGVVLTGQMDDGTAGLQAVKDCGGIAIVQDPATAREPEMPRSALRNVAVDHCVPLAEIGPLLARLVGTQLAQPAAAVPDTVLREVAINRGDDTLENLRQIASPSTLTCPDCGGTLWEVKATPPLRYRCHTGHAFSAASLGGAQRDVTEQALRGGVRALRERELLLRRMANIAIGLGDGAQAEAATAEADRLRLQVDALRQLTESGPPDLQPDTAA